MKKLVLIKKPYYAGGEYTVSRSVFQAVYK